MGSNVVIRPRDYNLIIFCSLYFIDFMNPSMREKGKVDLIAAIILLAQKYWSIVRISDDRLNNVKITFVESTSLE